MQETDALIVVDVQNDFCPGGALGVQSGDEIVPVLNDYIDKFRTAGLPVIATRDWHPAKTTHFKDYGGIWPVHCVQSTPGAAFHADLRLGNDAIVISKGMAADEDAYSAFQAKTDSGSTLAELLRGLGIKRIFVGGLATDYCVKQTALDGLARGFDVVILCDAVRGVNLNPDDSERALIEMRQAGAATLDSHDKLAV
ncbi:MAG TPA: bifunctional nicotinamidase/pyrazinamidase [Candidatus Binatia bacterium]|nr:bifunctional nicotinamidase/pyrazinamidase [Candidatus Binatia bacterium]